MCDRFGSRRRFGSRNRCGGRDRFDRRRQKVRGNRRHGRNVLGLRLGFGGFDLAFGGGATRHRFEQDRLLGLMRVRRADIELELRHHVAADFVFRHHPPDRQFKDAFRVFLEQLPSRFLALTAGPAGVA